MSNKWTDSPYPRLTEVRPVSPPPPRQPFDKRAYMRRYMAAKRKRIKDIRGTNRDQDGNES
jgi:hypothetical protein